MRRDGGNQPVLGNQNLVERHLLPILRRIEPAAHIGLFPLYPIGDYRIFAMFGYITFRSSKQDEQNRVWIGLAKETAHQLGTPTSSLFGWIEYLRTQPIDQTAVEEMNKDVVRLTKVVDRFSKIGSTTSLSEGVINEIVGGSDTLFSARRVPQQRNDQLQRTGDGATQGTGQ